MKIQKIELNQKKIRELDLGDIFIYEKDIYLVCQDATDIIYVNLEKNHIRYRFTNKEVSVTLIEGYFTQTK